MCGIILTFLFVKNVKYWKNNLINPLSLIYFFTYISLICDIVWICVEGNKEYASINYLVNVINNSCICLIGYCWVRYCNKMLPVKICTKTWQEVLLFIPALVIILLSCLTPKIGLMFTVDNNGNYVRGPLFPLQFVDYLYLLLGSIVSLISYSKTVFNKEKNEYLVYAFFALPTVALGMIQVLVAPGAIPVLQFSIVLSLLFVYIDKLDGKITVDTLTNLPNRNAIEVILDEKIKKYNKNSKTKLYVAFCDIDDFKIINDNHGHLFGDSAIKRTAKALNNLAFEYQSIPARLGGDEFLIIIESDKDINSVEFSNKLNNLIKDEFLDIDFNITISVGLEKYDGTLTMQELILEVDEKLYQEKKAKKQKLSL